MNRFTKTLGATAVAVLLASGAAFTNSVDGLPESEVIGYGATTVSGGTVESLDYRFNTAKNQIEGVDLVLEGDTTTSTVSLAFNDAAPTSCGAGDVSGAGETEVTTYDCANSLPTAELTKTAVFIRTTP